MTEGAKEDAAYMLRIGEADGAGDHLDRFGAGLDAHRSRRGIGALVLAEGDLYDMDRLLAGIVVLSVLGPVVSWGISRLEWALLGRG